MKLFRFPFVAPVLALLVLFSAASIVRAQIHDDRLRTQSLKDEAARARPRPRPVVQLSTDWSHRHLIYSNTAKQSPIPTHPRPSRYRPNLASSKLWLGAMPCIMASPNLRPPNCAPGPCCLSDAAAPAATEGGLTKDWTSSLTTGGTVGDEQYPAKFSFNINATPSCTADFVVFNNNQASGNHGTWFRG